MSKNCFHFFYKNKIFHNFFFKKWLKKWKKYAPCPTLKNLKESLPLKWMSYCCKRNCWIGWWPAIIFFVNFTKVYQFYFNLLSSSLLMVKYVGSSLCNSLASMFVLLITSVLLDSFNNWRKWWSQVVVPALRYQLI